ncbi:MAG: cell division topological specificity factor MinE [Cyanobacteria bacterium]|nr:cell division topological specificity factor MinE [Cyanobacteriota bacterium]
MSWLRRLFQELAPAPITSVGTGFSTNTIATPKNEACNRLKLVLMHDRTQLSATMMETLRDELVEVISKYVEIDKDALELNLEGESNTIALVANIPVLRARAAS